MKKPLLWRTLVALLAAMLIASGCSSDTDTGVGDADDAADDAAADDTADDTAADDTGTAADDTGTVADDTAADDDTDAAAADDAEDVVDNVAHPGSLLEVVKERGKLICGVSGTAVAFSYTDSKGSISGFDVDYCRAVAAAILGDADAVEFKALEAAERFTAVQSGAVDLLMRNTTWTQSRDTELGMDFGPTTYFDGQQLMARVSDGYSSESQVADIAGAVVCTNSGTTTEKNIADAADEAGIEITLNGYTDFDKVISDFSTKSCDVITTDGSALVGRKFEQEPEDEEWVIFPAKPISKEPLGPVYGQNDSKFADVVDWTVRATIIADEKGITMDNVGEMRDNPIDKETERLLGGEGELQTKMDLSADAFYQVIEQVGNYDEIFTRHLGEVGLSRDGSSNASYLDGGLIYSPPAR